MTKIPKSLQPILWSQDVISLDAKRDKKYIIHQVLRYGSIENLKWLFKNYSKNEIEKVFIQDPFPIYTPSSFYFARNIVLDIQQNLDEKRYFKSYI